MIRVYNWVPKDGKRSNEAISAVNYAVGGFYNPICEVHSLDDVPEPYRTCCMLIDAADGTLAGVGEGSYVRDVGSHVYWLEEGFVPYTAKDEL